MKLSTSAGFIATAFAIGLSPLTQAIQAKPKLDPDERLAMPTNLVAVVMINGKGKNATKTVELSWQDNATVEDQFIVERCQVTGKGNNKSCNFSPLDNVVADTTVFQDSPGVGVFKYRIKAVNVLLSSDYSNTVEI